MKEAVIALGCNLGDRLRQMEAAIEALSRLPRTRVLAVSRFYETDPFDVPEPQEDYLNACVRIETDLSAHVLLGACLGIEAGMGKVRTYRNAPRLIDLDLLLYDGERYNDQDLKLPHPGILQRAFVMVPLRDLYPEGVALGLQFQQELEQVGEGTVRLYSR